MDQEGQAKWQSSEDVARLWMHKVTGAHAMCGKRGEIRMGHILCHSKFPKNLVPSSQSNPGVGRKEISLDSGHLTTPAGRHVGGTRCPTAKRVANRGADSRARNHRRRHHRRSPGDEQSPVRTRVQEQHLSLAQQADEEVILTDTGIENNDEEEVEDEPPFNFEDDFFTKTKNRDETQKEKEQEPSLLPDRQSVSRRTASTTTNRHPSLEKVRQQLDQGEGPYL